MFLQSWQSRGDLLELQKEFKRKGRWKLTRLWLWTTKAFELWSTDHPLNPNIKQNPRLINPTSEITSTPLHPLWTVQALSEEDGHSPHYSSVTLLPHCTTPSWFCDQGNATKLQRSGKTFTRNHFHPSCNNLSENVRIFWLFFSSVWCLCISFFFLIPGCGIFFFLLLMLLNKMIFFFRFYLDPPTETSWPVLPTGFSNFHAKMSRGHFIFFHFTNFRGNEEKSRCRCLLGSFDVFKSKNVSKMNHFRTTQRG